MEQFPGIKGLHTLRAREREKQTLKKSRTKMAIDVSKVATAATIHCKEGWATALKF